MTGYFNLVEVFDMAIQKEKMRRDFYKKLKDRFADEKMKELFTSLYTWENNHVDIVTDIRDSLDEPKQLEFSAGELAPYWHILVEERLTTVMGVDEFCDKVSSEIEALDYAISFEKDAVLFFTELYGVVPNNKDMIQQIIDEEKKHIVYLADYKKEIGSR